MGTLFHKHLHPVINIQEKDTDPLADQSWCIAFSSVKKRLQVTNLDLIAVHSDRLHELQNILGYGGDEGDDEYDLWYTIWDNLITRTWLGMSLPQNVTYADVVTGNNVADIFTALLYCNKDPSVSMFMKRARIGPYIAELMGLLTAEDGPRAEDSHHCLP